MKRLLILLLAAAIGIGGYYLLAPGSSAQTKNASNAPARAVPVVVADAVQKPMPVQLSTIGRVQTVASVAVRSRIDGVITGVNVAGGFYKLGAAPAARLADQGEGPRTRGHRRSAQDAPPQGRRGWLLRQVPSRAATPTARSRSRR